MGACYGLAASRETSTQPACSPASLEKDQRGRSDLPWPEVLVEKNGITAQHWLGLPC